MQRALVSVDDLVQTLIRIEAIANEALNASPSNYLVALQRILNEADLELDRAERGEAA